MRGSPKSNRRGFTLIELIVVIALISILATMLFFTFPSFSGQNAVSAAADRISGALLIARQRAKRDNRVTGVRITQDPFGNWALFQYVQQPDAYAVSSIAQMSESPVKWAPLGWPPPPATPTANMPNTIFLNRLPGVGANFLPLFPEGGSEDTILPGDFIEIYNGGSVHQIVGVHSPTGANSGKIGFDALTVLSPTGASMLPTITFASTAPNYRIIRQPRLLSGEAEITLPLNIGLDLTMSNVQPSLSTTPAAFDILFTPSGAITGQGANTGQIYLWVRDLSADTTSNILNGFPVIVAVQMTTGYISSQQPVDPNDPYALTRDGRGSGL